MKRVGYLFESIVEMENLKQAFLKACCGKRLREDCQRFQANLDKELLMLREGLLSGTYPVGDYRRFKIFDPKEREICAASTHPAVLRVNADGQQRAFATAFMRTIVKRANRVAITAFPVEAVMSRFYSCSGQCPHILQSVLGCAIFGAHSRCQR